MSRRLVWAVLVAAVISLVVTLPAPTARADLSGHRWGNFDQHICVKFVGSHSKPLYLVDYAVRQWNALPDLKLTRKANCSGYLQKILISETKGTKDLSPAWVSYTGTSFPTPCYGDNCGSLGYYWGADSEGYWGWLRKSPIRVFINTSYSWTYASYKAAVVHELGHAAGALVHTDRCGSVMSEVCLGRWIVTEFDAYEVERQYPW